MKTQLDTDIASINNPDIRALVRDVLDAAPACFWSMPASTTGKYHPAHALGDGGLIRHTHAVAHITRHLLAMDDITGDLADTCIAAALLHDCCKKSDHERYTSFDHPIRAAELIARVHAESASPVPRATLTSLCAMVSAHMGRWNVDPRSGKELPRPLTPLQRLIHTADYLASRKQLSPAFPS